MKAGDYVKWLQPIGSGVVAQRPAIVLRVVDGSHAKVAVEGGTWARPVVQERVVKITQLEARVSRPPFNYSKVGRR